MTKNEKTTATLDALRPVNAKRFTYDSSTFIRVDVEDLEAFLRGAFTPDKVLPVVKIKEEGMTSKKTIYYAINGRILYRLELKQ